MNFTSDINTSKTINNLFQKNQNINNDIVENLKHHDDNHPTEINEVITKENKPKTSIYSLDDEEICLNLNLDNDDEDISYIEKDADII